MKLQGYNFPEELKELSNVEFYVLRSDFDQIGQDQFYLVDLLNYQVANESGSIIGKVTEVFSNGTQDVIEVDPIKEFIVIQSPFFISLDHEKKTCIVRVPVYL